MGRHYPNIRVTLRVCVCVNDDLKCQGDVYYTSADNVTMCHLARNER